MNPTGPPNDVRVDPDWIAAHLDDPTVSVIEVDVSRAAYDEGHIPGAGLWNAYSDLRHGDYRPISRAELETLLSRLGLTPDTTIVFYGYGQYLGFWLMKSYGHEQVRVMDGGRDRWTTAGHPWSTDVPTPSASHYSLPDEHSDIAASREVVQRASAGQDTVIVDVRSQAEFDGERFWPSGASEDPGMRRGHIPGSVHVPFEALRGEDGTFKSADELRRLYGQAGVVPDRDVITYCTIGNRASQVWFVLKYLLGYPNVAVYYGSWVEWGILENTPIETRSEAR